jgi:hypothetical protein
MLFFFSLFALNENHNKNRNAQIQSSLKMNANMQKANFIFFPFFFYLHCAKRKWKEKQNLISFIDRFYYYFYDVLEKYSKLVVIKSDLLDST